MLVKDCMTRHPIMIQPNTPATEAQQIMGENNIRYLPVVGDGKRLQGLITNERLALKPDTIGSLNVWEITRYLANLTVKQLMLSPKEIATIAPGQTVERAARVMIDARVGSLLVLEKDDVVVGVLSKSDLLISFQAMLGLPAQGVRVTIRMPNRKGEFGKLASVLADHHFGVMGIGSFPSPKLTDFYDVVVKIPGSSLETVQTVLKNIPDQEIIDIREVV